MSEPTPASRADGPERRRSVRRKVRQRIRVCFETPGTEAEGYLKNVSPRGLCVVTEHPPTPGEMIRLEFQDLACRGIRLTGVVRWSEPAAFGMLIDGPFDKRYTEFYEALLGQPDCPE